MPEIYFPQLASGAVAQYPIVRAFHTRTIANELGDGSLLKFSDWAHNYRTWQLHYRGISDGERSAIEELFRSVEGRLGSFTFLDPCGNLLRWSDRADKSVWQKDGQLQTLMGVNDESGNNTAWRLTNAAQTTQGIKQDVHAPSWFTYCFSANFKSSSSATIKLVMRDGAHSIDSRHVANNTWQKFQCAGLLGATGNQVTFRIDLDAGHIVDVCDLQVSAQPYAGAYFRTTERCGVTKVRFQQDQLRFTSEGIDDHSLTLTLRSLEESVYG